MVFPAEVDRWTNSLLLNAGTPTKRDIGGTPVRGPNAGTSAESPPSPGVGGIDGCDPGKLAGADETGGSGLGNPASTGGLADRGSSLSWETWA